MRQLLIHHHIEVFHVVNLLLIRVLLVMNYLNTTPCGSGE